MSIGKFKLNASAISNIVPAIIVVIGFYLSQPWRSLFLDVGMYAISGGLTNWLAIYMLFEKVPFMYGSGVILNRFESFKIEIHNMMMREFFSDEHLKNFLNKKSATISINQDQIFDHLVDAIAESSFGSMLSMMGGKKALEPLREPMKLKMQDILQQVISDSGQNDNKNTIKHTISQVITDRLNELTPKMVRDLIHQMIHTHLGWLVIWGSVMGGVIGLLVNLIYVF